MNTREAPKPKTRFPLGQVLTTPGALEAFRQAEQEPLEFLKRHQVGDWGGVSPEDDRENEISLRPGFRLLSTFQLGTGVKIWVISERDRSATTILLPSESRILYLESVSYTFLTRV